MINVSGLQEAGHINNTVVLIFRYFQYLHLMHSEVAWVLVSSETQVQLQIILENIFNNPQEYLSVSYDSDINKMRLNANKTRLNIYQLAEYK